MRMHFAVAGIDHQPLHVRFVDELLKQSLPDAAVAPPAKPPVRVLPVAVARRKIAPGCARAQNPENRVQKPTVVVGNASPLPALPGQMRLKALPGRIRYVVSSCAISHAAIPSCFDDRTLIKSRDDTA